MPSLMPTGKQQFFIPGTATPLVGGKLYTYAAGTSTPKSTWQDAAGTIPNTNPITLDSTGSALVFWTGNYKIVLKDSLGNTVYTVDSYNTDQVAALQNALGTPSGADSIGFLQSGASAVARTLLDRGRDTVSAFDFMTAAQIANVRNGIPTDITAAVQAAINSMPTFSGTVELPPGNFRLSASLVTASKGLVLKGASKYGTYLTAPDGATWDMLRIAHQQCEVCGIIWRPGSSSQVPIRAYAGRAYIHDNYLLAAVNNAGIGILLTDTNPVDNSFVAGAYNHTVENNVIGDTGFAFAYGITESSQFGITATRFVKNTILSDRPIQINKGGGNTYRDNLLQSSTGTASTKAGVGITLGAGVVGEKIQGNYIELFLAMIETQNSSNTYQLFHAIGNHNDNCNAPVSDAGSKNYVIEDTVGRVENRFGWSTRYTPTQYGTNTPSGVSGFGMDTSGNCFMGAQAGSNHLINRVGAVEGNIILTLQGNGNSASFASHVTGAGGNAGACALSLKANSSTGRSLNSGGTNNAMGNDYAEYMSKAQGCGSVAKGQIVGINASDEITDRWADAVAFAVKSTDPSFVGGDIWAAHLGERPQEPVYIEPEYAGVTTGRAPVEPESTGDEERDQVAAEVYTKALADWAATRAQEQVDRAAFAALVDQARADHKAAMEKWEVADKQYEVDYEAARVTVDRVAFAGRVPVNVLGATPGQYIVPVQDGDGIKGVFKNESDMTLIDHMRAVGKVTAIEPDGRARIIVKIA